MRLKKYLQIFISLGLMQGVVSAGSSDVAGLIEQFGGAGRPVLKPIDSTMGGGAGAVASGFSEPCEGGRLEYLASSLRGAEKQIRDQLAINDPAVPRVLLLGVTGSGKSTLLHALMGRSLVIKDEGGYPVLEPARGEELLGFSVGHTISSVTESPTCCNDGLAGLSFWDCPGFLDSRGAEQEIINSFTLDHLFEAPSRVKTLLVIQESEIIDSRGTGVLGQFKKLGDLFTITEELYRGIVLVITKTQRSASPIALLGKIGENAHPLVRFFLEHPERVFSFPAPQLGEKGIYRAFRKEEIILQLQTDPIENPKHAVSLDALAFFRLLEMSNHFDIKKNISALLGAMQDSYRGKGLRDLKSWERALKTLLDSSDEVLDRPESLMHLAFDIAGLPNQEVLRDFFDPLASSWRFMSLISKIQTGSGGLSLDFSSISATLRPFLKGIYEEVNLLVRTGEAAEVEKKRAAELRAELERKKQESLRQEQEHRRRVETLQKEAKEKGDRLKSEIDQGKLTREQVLKAQEKIRRLEEGSKLERKRVDEEYKRYQQEVEEWQRQSTAEFDRQRDALSRREAETRRSLLGLEGELERLRNEQSRWADQIESAKRTARSGIEDELRSLRAAHSRCDDKIEEARRQGQREGAIAALQGRVAIGGFGGGFGFGGPGFFIG